MSAPSSPSLLVELDAHIVQIVIPIVNLIELGLDAESLGIAEIPPASTFLSSQSTRNRLR
jgi:hypothetical protein